MRHDRQSRVGLDGECDAEAERQHVLESGNSSFNKV